MPLTNDRNTLIRDGKQGETPVAASQVIYAGAIVMRNAAGNAVRGAVALNLVPLGIAEERADNAAGAAGAINVKWRRTVGRFRNSSAGDLITIAHVNTQVFVADDDQVALTNGTNTRSPAGVVRAVDSDGVWVEIGTLNP